jgi:N-acyl-D-amino-acid deacylase
MVAQGVTTLVVNQDGRSPWPIREQRQGLQENGVGPNAVLLVGHGTVRNLVMGDDFRRSATALEIGRMKQLVRQGMEEGAWGMSAGHEYSPMIWSTTDEMVALVEELAPWHGIYVVHERSSGTEPMWWWPSQDPPGAPTVLDSILETIEVAERTGVTSVQTHLKARGANLWGASRMIINLIERARNRGVKIWGDAYTYNTTGSDGNTVLIPRWVLNQARKNSGQAAPDYGRTLTSLLETTETAEAIRRDVQHEMTRRGGPENLLIVEHPDPKLIGRRLHEIASEQGLSPVEMALRFQLEGETGKPGGARLRGFSLSNQDVEAFHAQPWVMTASDAAITLPGDGLVHPRFYGNFPRKIRRFALDLGIVSTEDAIRSMTSLPAQVLGLRDRGLLREGHWADLVVLDLELIQDRATALDPHQYPTGIDYVLVNGQLVVEQNQLTFALPGKVLVP